MQQTTIPPLCQQREASLPGVDIRLVLAKQKGPPPKAEVCLQQFRRAKGGDKVEAAIITRIGAGELLMLAAYIQHIEPVVDRIDTDLQKELLVGYRIATVQNAVHR